MKGMTVNDESDDARARAFRYELIAAAYAVVFMRGISRLQKELPIPSPITGILCVYCMIGFSKNLTASRQIE